MKKVQIGLLSLTVLLVLAFIFLSSGASAQLLLNPSHWIYLPNLINGAPPGGIPGYQAPLSYDMIVNGGFEANNGWVIPETAWPAGYTTTRAHTGSRSMRTGITSSGDNTYSYSDFRQGLTIPKHSSTVQLTFYIYTLSSEPTSLALPIQNMEAPFGTMALSSDVQYVLILDSNFNWIDTLVWQRSNDREWTSYVFDLSDYSGQSIYLQFGTYNDGNNGITSMFVDDVTLEINPPPAGPTATATSTLAPGACTELVKNGSFETGSGWNIPATEYTAGYSTKRAVTGVRSLRTGIVNEADNTFSYSAANQAVHIPSRIGSAILSFWLYPITGESTELALPPIQLGTKFGLTALSSDVQYVLILDSDGNWIDTLVWERSNDRTWEYYEFDLKEYAGQTIILHFGSYNDGLDGVTSLFVDDVSLQSCAKGPTSTPKPTKTATPTRTATLTRTPTPTGTVTPIPSATPVGCSQVIVNPSFETNTGWDIPITVWPAGYSSNQAHTGARSMRTGITSAGDNAFSYSDARQRVRIPANATSADLSLWVYPKTTESSTLALPQIQLGTVWGKSVMSSDVQYLLILDENEIWIDTLIWMRSNAGTWKNYTFDLSDYAGSTIYLQFGTYNNGTGGITYMYVDDFNLQICRP